MVLPSSLFSLRPYSIKAVLTLEARFACWGASILAVTHDKFNIGCNVCCMGGEWERSRGSSPTVREGVSSWAILITPWSETLTTTSFPSHISSLSVVTVLGCTETIAALWIAYITCTDLPRSHRIRGFNNQMSINSSILRLSWMLNGDTWWKRRFVKSVNIVLTYSEPFM
jgi:hypothetical protein